MPITYHIEPEAGLLVSRLDGEVTVAMLMEYNLAVRGDPAFHTGLLALVTVGEVQLNFTFEEMRTYSEWYATQPALRCTAVIAKTDLAFGMARSFNAMMEARGMEAMVFRDETAAREWLASREEGAGRP